MFWVKLYDLDLTCDALQNICLCTLCSNIIISVLLSSTIPTCSTRVNIKHSDILILVLFGWLSTYGYLTPLGGQHTGDISKWCQLPPHLALGCISPPPILEDTIFHPSSPATCALLLSLPWGMGVVFVWFCMWAVEDLSFIPKDASSHKHQHFCCEQMIYSAIPGLP